MSQSSEEVFDAAYWKRVEEGLESVDSEDVAYYQRATYRRMLPNQQAPQEPVWLDTEEMVSPPPNPPVHVSILTIAAVGIINGLSRIAIKIIEGFSRG